MIGVLLVQGSAERAGAEGMLHHLLKFMDRTSFKPTVLFLADGPFVNEVKDLGVDVIVQPLPVRLRDIGRWGKVKKAVGDAIDATGAEVVHANGEKMSILAAGACRAKGVPCIAWLHDAPGAGGFAGKAAQKLLARAPLSAVITCATWLADAFNQELGIDARPILNGLDLDSLLAERGDAERLRDEMGWPKDAVVVGHFARLQRWKGTDFFLRAAAQLHESHPEIRFLIVGGALYGRELEYAASLERLAESLGIAEVVSFTGYRADAHRLMSDCDIVVHCSTQPDPFPTVILEAMTMGKAIVASRTGGPEEALVDGVTGLLVQPSDHVVLADAIERLAEDEGLRSTIGGKANEDALTRFHGRRMASEFEDLYRSLAGADVVEGAR